MKNAISNEICISTNSTKDVHGLFSEEDIFFDDEFLSKLINLEGMQKTYPFYAGKLNMNELNQSVKIYEGSTQIIEYPITEEEDYLTSYQNAVFPYYPEQKLYELCEENNSNKTGVYLEYHFAQVIGITNITENMRIKCNVYVPVAAVDTTYEVYFAKNPEDDMNLTGTYPGERLIYEQVKLDLPISGILPASYDDTAVGSGYHFFIPYETMEQYINMGISQHQEEENNEYITKKSSCYKVFVSDFKYIEKIKDGIMNMSDSVTVRDGYANLEAMQNASQDNISYLKFCMIILFTVALVLIIMFSFIHKKDAESDYYFYNTHGLSKCERKIITLAEMLIIFASISILSIITMNILTITGIGDYKLLNNGALTYSYQYTIFLCLILSALMSVIGESVLLLKG